MYAITHPSQPNYLEFFSGANQGVFDNNVPAGAPFATPNLAAELRAAGLTFATYSEDLPAIGSTVSSSLGYVRRHNPVVNWQNNVNPTANQLPLAMNLPFSSFPSNFNLLPTVSYVVPNLAHDMHDGTIAQADAWLQTNLGAYATWAQTHNSMLIVTWDEDSFTSRNHIPTIFSGPMVQATQVASTWTLHNILRTVEDMYGLGHAGAAANVRPIVGAFVGDVPTRIATFQQGAGGYTGTIDTYLNQGNPGTTHGAANTVVVDNGPVNQGLIRFDGIIGPASGQVKQGSKILSAKLSIQTGPSSATGDNSVDNMSIFPMIRAWDNSSTWNSLAAGVSTDGLEAATTAEFSLVPNVRDAWAVFDVTRTLQGWINNPAQNQGWMIQSDGTDGWRWDSSEYGTANLRPILEIVTSALVEHPWQNATLIWDADDSGTVEPADALTIIDALNTRGPGPLLIPPLAPNAPPPYYDVSGDDSLSPLDALIVINRINIGASASFSMAAVSASAVPEPSGGVLTLIALAGVGLVHLRCRKPVRS
jgi:hypothetical protein